MTTPGYSDDVKVMDLLAPLRRLEPVPFAVPQPAERPWLRRPALMAASVAVAFGLACVSIAGGLGAFDGTGAARHPLRGADAIDPATRAYLEGGHGAPIIRGLLFDTARVVGHVPGRRNVYAITTSWHGLCFVVGPPGPEWNCDDQPSRSHPSAVFIYARSGKPWTAVGIALAGVRSVSFDVGGRQVTVPVRSHVWKYRSGNVRAIAAPMLSLTAHFADGSAVVERH